MASCFLMSNPEAKRCPTEDIYHNIISPLFLIKSHGFDKVGEEQKVKDKK